MMARSRYLRSEQGASADASPSVFFKVQAPSDDDDDAGGLPGGGAAAPPSGGVGADGEEEPVSRRVRDAADIGRRDSTGAPLAAGTAGADSWTLALAEQIRARCWVSGRGLQERPRIG
jgi:hypothetical protein